MVINKLKDDKRKLVDNETLLTQLLGQIQGYFSKIDSTMTRVASEEEDLFKTLQTHQEDESVILKALETNQSLFLDRMDKIVGIQQNLSDKISISNTTSDSLVSPEMIRMATSFMSSQKREMQALKSRIDLLAQPLENLRSVAQDIQHSVAPDFSAIENAIKDTLAIQINALNQNIDIIKEETFKQSSALKSSSDDTEEAVNNIKALTQHTDIAKRNIQNVIEQSIDLNPIYKSIHELMEQMKTMFTDYHLAKNEIAKLLQALQEHEHRDLIELKDEVSHFLDGIKEEMKLSVKMLKEEYHLGQTQVTDTVKTLSDRSMANNAYQQGQENP